MRKALLLALSLALISVAPMCFAAHDIGTPLTADEIAPWNIDVAPDGRGLPAGSGDVATGAHVFAAKCAACHGALGQGLIGDALVGGRGTLASARPKRTVGSYWPYATTLFDYIRRAMPYNAPESLSADDARVLSDLRTGMVGTRHDPPGGRLDGRRRDLASGAAGNAGP